MPRNTKRKTKKDPIVVLCEKLKKYIKKRGAILANYGNDFNQLRLLYNEHMIGENNNNTVKSDWKRIKYINKNIGKVQNEIRSKCAALNIPSPDRFFTVEDNTIKCNNCHRVPMQNCPQQVYSFELLNIQSDCIHARRPFKFISSTMNDTNSIEYLVCEQCKNHLTNDNNNFACEDKNTWPGFLWYLLHSPEMHESYTSHFVWRFIPRHWRHWWFSEITTTFPSFYNDISLEEPPPIFHDRTEDLSEWNKCIGSLHLQKIADVCNKLLMPTVLCPWGCSEFVHKAGFIHLMAVFQRYIRKVHLKVDTSSIDLTESARDDYIRKNVDDYDAWLYNPNWRVIPCIVFRDGSPQVMVCKDHDGGSNLLHIHIPRWKSNLSPSMSDQVCHAVVKPRTVKQVKASYNSIGYQMVEQRVSWKGPDSVNYTSIGRFNHKSRLLFEAEARSFANRFDIRSLIQKLVDDGKMSNFHASGIEDFSSAFSNNIDYDYLKIGSTYVPLEAAMTMKRDAGNMDCVAIIDNETDDNGEVKAPYTKKFKRTWPLFLYPCQKVTSHGARMLTVPLYQVDYSFKLWLSSALLLCIEPLWSIISSMEMRTSQYYGHLLVYLTKECIPYLNRRSNCIFSKLNITELNSKLDEIESVEELFGNISGVYCTELVNNDETIDNNMEPDRIHEVLSNSDSSSKVIIISNVASADAPCERYSIGNLEYELCFCASIWDDEDGAEGKFEAEVFARHGRNFTKWWYQDRRSKIMCETDSAPVFEDTKHNIIAFVQIIDVDPESLRNEFFHLIGGSIHIQCSSHKLPLIVSPGDRKCQCGRRKEHLCCPIASCSVVLCKRCSELYSRTTTNFVSPPEVTNGEDRISNDQFVNEETDSIDDNHDGSDMFVNPPADDESLDNSMDEYLGMTEPPIVDFDDISHSDDDIDFYCGLCAEEEDTGIPTTNAADTPTEVYEETAYGGHNNELIISGSGLLSECTTILTRKRFEIHGSKREKCFVQRCCATTSGSSSSLLYFESASHSGIFWATAPDNYSMLGAIPSPLYSMPTTKHGFADIPKHVRSRVTSPGSPTSSCPRYLILLHDLLCTIASNHSDTRLFSKKGMTAASDSVGGFDLRGKEDSSFLNSIDSRKIVLNLCASQEYFVWDFFLTFTCNMRKHFGTKPIREWLDGNSWEKYYPNFDKLPPHHQEEIKRAILQAASGLFLRVWEEVSAIFIDYLRNSTSSSFRHALAIFARKEYQTDKGNLSHIHALLKLNDKKLSQDDKDFIADLIRNDVFDVVRPNEVQGLIDEGYIQSEEDIYEVQDDQYNFTRHRCGPRCLVYDASGKLVCRATNHQISEENTKHSFVPLPSNWSNQCLERLERAGIAELTRNECGNITSFKSHMDYFHPKKFVPAWKYGDPNLSPVDGKTFIVCRSMQNCQRLCGSGGSCKYCCKYITKLDKNNYMSVATNANGDLIRRSNFMHNTKISSSNYFQEKEREKKRDWKHPQGRCMSINEILHHILKYPEVITDLRFEDIPTVSLELRTGISLKTRTHQTQNSGSNNSNANNIPELNQHREDLPMNRLFTVPQIETYEDMFMNRKSSRVDKITRFSMRPPELLKIVDMVGMYFRWFHISDQPLKNDEVASLLEEEMWQSAFIDGFNHQIRIRKKALPELMEWIGSIEDEDTTDLEMVNYFRQLNDICSMSETELNTNEFNKEFHAFAIDHVIHNDDKEKHLPIPTYSYIKPSMGPQFLLHILLSMGRFETERQLLLNNSLKESFRYAKLIGPEDDMISLEHYSNKVFAKFVHCQLQFYPNGQRIIDSYIIRSGDLFDSVIVKNEIPLYEMPSVQLSALLQNRDEKYTKFLIDMKRDIINAATRELGDLALECNVPSTDDLMRATLDEPLQWDPIANFVRSSNQSLESYREQLFAIKECVKAINNHVNIMRNGFVKNIIIAGFPGGGKTFCMMFIVLYARSRGLNVLPTAMMSHRAVQLGGWHWHKLLCIPPDKGNNMSVYRQAELALQRLERYPNRIEFIKTIHMFASDEIGQRSAEFDDIIDTICRHVRGANVYKGGIMEIATFDPTQLQPIRGKPFLVSPNILPCFNIVQIKHSVRAQDSNFYRLQEIARMSYRELENNPVLIEEFKELCDGFTFVDSWADEKITPETFRIYARQIPAKQASKDFIESVKQHYPDCLERKAIDSEKRRYSNQEWRSASPTTITALESKLKEPERLLFFKGAIYQCTYNEDGVFSQSQLALLYDVPQQEDIDNFRKINILLFPPNIKLDGFEFDPSKPKSYYISTLNFKEVKIGLSMENIEYLPNDVQAVRRQYGLRHFITGTIHGAMGDTYYIMATSVSNVIKQLRLWEKGQLIVLISRTRTMKNTIFVGSKSDTIAGLVELLTKRSQWSNYMDQVMDIVTIRDDSTEIESGMQETNSVMNQINYPFRLCDIDLPQDKTGAVYLMRSKKDPSYVILDSCMCLRTQLLKINTGSCISSGLPLVKQPFVLLAYICGFEKNKDAIDFVKQEWKEEQHNDSLQWARNGEQVISRVNGSIESNLNTNGLRIVLLFRE